MKKLLFCIIILTMATGIAFSQGNNQWKWGGLVRFRPLATIIGLAVGGFEVVADWVPYVTPSVGIPIEVDIFTINGISGFGIMGGFEAIPVRHKEKSGLFLTALLGPLFMDQNVTFIGRANIGYQLVTDSGFVFTPALGVKYNNITGIGLDLMLDIGFAYRR
ncbi:MAG: hypothetical protein FWF29_04040 [Treponema sp.]|nr:hypothetical protein [Treponema sp.]